MLVFPAMATVLLIDDDEMVRVTLEAMLQGLGHRVIAPPSSKQALQAIQARGYDVVMTDCVMPEVDGTRIVKAVRAIDGNCPIVAMSGGSRRTPADIALTLTQTYGANATLYKPFTQRELIAALDAAMGGPKPG